MGRQVNSMRFLILALILAAVAPAQDKWTPLFDGKTLNGWEVCNGFAKYAVENGEIVGATVDKSPNSFLCTKKEFGDFILELDVKVDGVLNSGMQIRSHRYQEDRAVKTFNGKAIVERKQSKGRVHGYQIEVSPDGRGVSGGIYDEARRGWLQSPAENPAGAKAFKNGEWNTYRIQAIGDNIRVWVNGVQTADLVDSMDLTGFIALQVHSFKGPHPEKVRWRNIRIQDLGRHAWKPVFDGRSLDGWSQQGGGVVTVEDGALRLRSKDDDERTCFVISDRAVSDVTTRLKFKILKGNSGFFVRTQPPSMKGYEVEIDAEKQTGGFWEVGGRRWVTGPEDNAGVMKDDWNELTASLHGRRIVFQLNGVKTVELPNDVDGVTLDGRLAVQAHGSKRPTEVWFKDIEILEKVK